MKNLFIVILLAALFTACQSGAGDKSSAGDESQVKSLTAAGATFPMPFYNLVFKKYTNETDVLLTYGGIGSGGGIRSLKDRVVDFGATDAFLDDEAIAEMPAPVVHIPTCIGAVVMAFNIPGVDNLKLSHQNLEDICMGGITNWNDPRLKATNPDVDFPDLELTFVNRSDGSGTTFIFSDYMSKISEKWSSQVGSGKSLKWPVGIGAKGNPGVAGTISQTQGAIGYIGSEYAFAQNIPFALLENASGNYIKPTIESISAAAKGDIPDDTRIMITNSAAPDAYPISGFTWIILYQEQAYNDRPVAKGTETLNFLNWLIDEDAQAVARQVHYAPLPEDAVIKARQILKSVTFNGKPIMK